MFINFKNKFASLNKSLRNKLFEEKKNKNKIQEKQVKNQDYKKNREERMLDEKYKKVEEKLKTGKKLTTADLIGMSK